MKKIIGVVIAGLLVVGISFGFVKIFAFEEKPKEEETVDKHPTINVELINKLYSYISVEDEQDRETMYTNYTRYQNISAEVSMRIIYNYIEKYESEKLIKINDNEFKPNVVDKKETLYKISISDMEEAFKKVFGSEEKIIYTDFRASDGIKAKYVENDGYYIYLSNSAGVEPNFVIDKKIDRYEITDKKDTIIIYDYFVKCKKENSMCYDNERMNMQNNHIVLNGDVTTLKDNLTFAKGYKHTFKFENGYYYWYSSEFDA